MFQGFESPPLRKRKIETSSERQDKSCRFLVVEVACSRNCFSYRPPLQLKRAQRELATLIFLCEEEGILTRCRGCAINCVLFSMVIARLLRSSNPFPLQGGPWQDGDQRAARSGSKHSEVNSLQSHRPLQTLCVEKGMACGLLYLKSTPTPPL